MNAVISTKIDNIEELKNQLSNVPEMEGLELASKVSTKNLIILVMKMQLIKLLP